KGADKDRQKRGRATGLAHENPGQPFHRIDGSALVDKEPSRPVAAAHIAWDLHDKAEVQAREVRISEMTAVDAQACPSLTVAFGRRVAAEREHAGAEYGAITGENQLSFHRPSLIGHGPPRSLTAKLLAAPLPTQAV